MAAGSGPRGNVSSVVLWNVTAGAGVILAILGVLRLLSEVVDIVILLLTAIFFAVVLSPAVEGAHRRLHIRRGPAITVVFVTSLAAAIGLGYVYFAPLYRGARHLATDAPTIVAKAQQGEGPVGDVARRFHMQEWVTRNAQQIPHALRHAEGPAIKVVTQVVSGAALLTLLAVLTFMILLEGPHLIDNLLSMLDEGRADRLRRVGREVSRTMTGYVLGNVATSLVAGTVVAITLLAVRVPFPVVFGVWVAMVDLLPQVGGLLAGIPTVLFAAAHSLTSGVIVLVVFLIYQQIENHILNPVIMSRTVRLSPLWVLLSVLIAARLGGIVGALFAIPAAGTIQVVAREVLGERGSRRASEDEGAEVPLDSSDQLGEMPVSPAPGAAVAQGLADTASRTAAASTTRTREVGREPRRHYGGMTNPMTVWGTALARPVSLERDHVRGPVDAPVSLVEYGDFECPFCDAAHGVVDAVQAALGDLLQFVYRHFPLTTVHPHAFRAAEAAEAAGAQGQFWPMYDLLFEDQQHLASADLMARARALRLDVDRFQHDLAIHAHADRVQEDFTSGVHSGVNGTPSFFVNGLRYEGPTDAATMIAVIEAALAPAT